MTPSSIGAALCLAGAGTCIHLVRTPRSCSAVIGLAQCDAVLSSGWATVPLPGEHTNVPLAVLGLGYFSVLLTWFVLVGWTDRKSRGGWIPSVLVTFGLCVSVGLVGVMALDLQAWCGTCLAVHALNAGLAGLVWWPAPHSGSTVSQEALHPFLALTTLGCGLALACGLGVAAVRVAKPPATDTTFVQPDDLDQAASTKAAVRPVRARNSGSRIKLSRGQPVFLSGQTLDGNRFDSRDAAGGATLAIVWASRCGHCRQEASRIEALHRSLTGKGVRVIGVNLDRTRVDADRFIARQHLTWPQIAAAENPAVRDVVTRLGITSIPKLLLIGSDGRLVEAANNLDELSAAWQGHTAAAPP